MLTLAVICPKWCSFFDYVIKSMTAYIFSYSSTLIIGMNELRRLLWFWGGKKDRLFNVDYLTGCQKQKSVVQ